MHNCCTQYSTEQLWICSLLTSRQSSKLRCYLLEGSKNHHHYNNGVVHSHLSAITSPSLNHCSHGHLISTWPVKITQNPCVNQGRCIAVVTFVVVKPRRLRETFCDLRTDRSTRTRNVSYVPAASFSTSSVCDVADWKNASPGHSRLNRPHSALCRYTSESAIITKILINNWTPLIQN